jgi:hypothetical protein
MFSINLFASFRISSLKINCCRNRIVLYLQSYLYFDKFNKELRQQFIFKDEIRKEANKLIENILKENHITTHTDYMLNPVM